MTNGRKYLVTGASRGIGLAIAERLLSEGAAVIGTFNTSADEARALEQKHPLLTMKQVDLSERSATRMFVQVLGDEKLDGIVNNAGIIEFERWDDFTMESWDRVLEVNLNAVLAIASTLGRRLTSGAAIVNVASTDGTVGSFASISYAASKAALLNVTQSLANVLGPQGIRVNAVAPGWVNTGMATDESHEAAALTPLGRNGTPADVADVVVFLLGESSRYITGATLVVDGGYTCVDSIMKQENDSLE